MILFLGGDSIAGGKLKETGNEHWENNEDATNSSGFTMLPAGYRSHSNGASNSMGIIGYCWTASEINEKIAFGYATRYYGPPTTGSFPQTRSASTAPPSQVPDP